MRFATLALIILLASPLAVLAEDQNFPAYAPWKEFEAGWDDVQIRVSSTGIVPSRMAYPATYSGESKPMSEQGTFPVVIFFTDSGESRDQYVWLQDDLAQSGIITLIIDDNFVGQSGESDSDSAITGIRNELIDWNTNGGPIDNMTGQMAMTHWGVAGHGTGATSAAQAVHDWNKTDSNPPRALFGLGIDSDGEIHDSARILARPSIALFITGTVDEIAPADENAVPFLSDWPGAWQLIHPLGANHLQYQESTSFFQEQFGGDGDATMSVDAQRDHALHYIKPYLNLTLRGIDSAFKPAFNRETSDNPVASDAYLDEDMSRARLFALSNVNLSSSVVGIANNTTISVDVTSRQGVMTAANVSCESGGSSAVGLLADGVASCIINGSGMSPGFHKAIIRIHDQSFSDWTELQLQRIGSPLTLISPTPDLIFPQRSSGILQATSLANDPDGQEIVFTSATLHSEEGVLEVNLNGTSLTVSHIDQDQWIGHVNLSVNMSAGGGDVTSTIVKVIVTEVDDPVVLNAAIEMLVEDEDNGSLMLDLSAYVSDPEGAEIQLSPPAIIEGLSVSLSGSEIVIQPDLNWNGAAIINLPVSDGTTAAIIVEIPVRIEAVDDAMWVNESSWNITMDEDSAIQLNLSSFAGDIDGDVLTWSLSGASLIVDAQLSSVLDVVGIDNQNGLTTSLILEVTDGNTTFTRNLIIEVLNVADIPTVSMTSSVVGDGRVDILWSLLDADSNSTHRIEMLWEFGEANATHACTGDEIKTCASAVVMPEAAVGEELILRLQVWDEEAQQWSNTDSRIIVAKELPKAVIEDVSGFDTPQWLLPATIGVVILLLLILISQGGSKSDDLASGEPEGEPELEVVMEVEVEVEEPRGLLARAAKKS